MPQLISVEEALKLQNVVIDVRSEGEFMRGHIPGAFNICLLNNEERKEIGTTYKQKGREEAVLQGFELVGHKFGSIIKSVKEVTNEKNVTVYCWRGGMRSNIVAWVLKMAGYKVSLIKGGYKIYRNWVLKEVVKPRKFIVLGGKTGSGKTEMLNEIKLKGEPVLDLEALANHKGSSFGALGMNAQPSTEHFENLLASNLHEFSSEVIWIENESRMVGKVKIPDLLFDQMRSSRVIEMEVDNNERIDRIVRDYGKFPLEELKECTFRLKKKLGDLRCREAIRKLEEGHLNEWVNMMLEYYDGFYEYGNSNRDTQKIHVIKSSPDQRIEKLIEYKDQLVKKHKNEFSN